MDCVVRAKTFVGKLRRVSKYITIFYVRESRYRALCKKLQKINKRIWWFRRWNEFGRKVQSLMFVLNSWTMWRIVAYENYYESERALGEPRTLDKWWRFRVLYLARERLRFLSRFDFVDENGARKVQSIWIISCQKNEIIERGVISVKKITTFFNST